MFLREQNFRLTKHGRQQYLQRVGKATDTEIIVNSVEGIHGFRAIWKPDSSGLRLVTILEEK